VHRSLRLTDWYGRARLNRIAKCVRYLASRSVLVAKRTSIDQQESARESPSQVATASHDRVLAWLLLIIALTFNLYQLYPEVATRTPMLNDGAMHLLNVARVVVAVVAGQDPTDPWLATIAQGFPLFHYYQHLAYLPPAALYLVLFFLFGQTPPLADVYSWINYLLLSIFPLSIYWSARRFGLDRLLAALAGLVASLVATDGLYGLDFVSYVWRGFGLYTQLWGMILLPMGLAQGYAVLRDGRGYLWAVFLLSATLLSHLVFGYIAVASLFLLAVVGAVRQSANKSAGEEVLHRTGRLAGLLGLLVLVSSYFVVPFLADSAYMNRGVWELPQKYDSYGHEWVLGTLFRGNLFDFGRFPSLSLLAAVGLLVCVRKWHEARYRVPLALSVLWLLLYFGRPTWGVLLNLLPMSHDLHLHRLIAGVHLGGIYLIGIGLGVPWRWAVDRRHARYLVAAVGVTALLLLPVYRERAAFLGDNARWMRESRDANAVEQGDVNALLDTLRALPPGRVYAGLAATWGKDYRVGAVPVYALLQRAGLDMLGYLYHGLSLNADIQVLFDERRAEQYNLFNVRYVVAPTERAFPDFVKPVRDFGRHRLYQVDTSGYFDLVGSDLTLLGSKDDFFPAASRWLASDEPRVKDHPVLRFGGATADFRQSFPLAQADALIPRDVLPAEPARGQVVSETVANNMYLAQVNVERDSTLLLKTTYHPNWHAYVDGAESNTVMLMPSYLGVPLGAGAHSVRLEYRPQPLRGLLMFVGLLTLMLTGLVEWRWKAVAPLTRRLSLARPAGLLRRPGLETTSWWPLLAVKQQLSPHLPYLGGLTLAVLLAGLPLVQFKLWTGHDALEYLPRNVEFYRVLSAGQVFPRWAPDLSGGYGEPFFSFNPPLFYYLSAFFHAAGFSFVAAENVSCLLLLVLAALGMYLLSNEFFGPRGGLVSSVAYLFAPYFLVTLYVRHALADFSALAFIPLAVWGLYRFVAGGRYLDLLIGALSIALLLLSSNPVALFTLPALVLLLAWVAWKGQTPRVLRRGIWCLTLGLALPAFFWAPAVLERDFVHTQRLLEGFLNYRNHFAYADQLFSSAWGYGVSVPGRDDGMSFAIGPIHLALSAASLLLLQRIRRTSAPAALMLSFAVILFLLAAFFSTNESAFAWERLPLLQYLEYPWRFLTLVAVSTAFLCGSPFLLLARRQHRLANGLMAALLVGLLALNVAHARPETFLAVTDADVTPEKIAARYIAVTTAREYEPIWVTARPATAAGERVRLLAGQGRISVIRESPTEQTFTADLNEESRLRVNTFYFPGWTLYVDGVQRPIDRSNPQGVMEFSVEQGIHQMRLVLVDTPARSWATGLSVLAVILLMFTPWLKNTAQLGGRVNRQRFFILWRYFTGSPAGVDSSRRLVDHRGGIAGFVADAAQRTLIRLRTSQSTPDAPLIGPVARPVTQQHRSWGSYAATKQDAARHIPYMAGVALVALLAGLPLLQFRVMSGHDALIYLPATVELYEGLRTGQLFPRWSPDLNWGYGEPFFNFLPPLVHYVSVVFHALGFSFVASENLACLALLLLAGLSMYLLAEEFLGQPGGLVCATAYMFAPFVLVSLYVRHGLRDFAAFAFLPLVIWALYRFAHGGPYRFFVIGASSAALLSLSSNSVALISFPAFGFFLIWRSWASRSFRPLIWGGWCLAVGLGLAAFFWLPALVEGGSVQLGITVQGWFDYHNHFLYLYQLIYSPWGYRYSLPGPDYGMSFAIGPVHLCLIATVLLLRSRLRRRSTRAWLVGSFFLTLLLLSAFFTTHESLFIWESLPLLHPLVFPWRFLSLVTVSVAFLCGFPLLLVPPGNRWAANGVTATLLALLIVTALPHARPEAFQDLSEDSLSSQAILASNMSPSRDGFLAPNWVKQPPQAPPAERLTILSGQGNVTASMLVATNYEFRVDIADSARLRVNTFYFPGWTLYVDGVERPTDHTNLQGVMEFSLEPGLHSVVVRFEDTPVRQWATRFSLLSLFVLVLQGWLPRWIGSRSMPRSSFSAGRSLALER
jgi:6-pyruvoyl-tetrahydropterin synthase related domain